jgi:hypothetical protein
MNLRSRKATVDGMHRAGRIAGVIRESESHETSYIVRRSMAAEGNSLRERLVPAREDLLRKL